jgi:hypothetical protein
MPFRADDGPTLMTMISGDAGLSVVLRPRSFSLHDD